MEITRTIMQKGSGTWLMTKMWLREGGSGWWKLGFCTIRVEMAKQAWVDGSFSRFRIIDIVGIKNRKRLFVKFHNLNFCQKYNDKLFSVNH